MLKKWVWAFKSCNISETRQDRTKVTFVTIEDQQEVVDALSTVPIVESATIGIVVYNVIVNITITL